MDNRNGQIPPVQSGQPMQPMSGGMPQNEVSRILMSQGSMPGGMTGGGAMPQNNMVQGAPQGAPAAPQRVTAQNPGMMPQVLGPDGRPMIQKPMSPPPKKKDVAGLVKTIVIIVLSVITATFIGLFIWQKIEYEEQKEISSDVEAKINEAVAIAKDEQWNKDEKERLESEKYPYRTFSGPVDYGQLTFEYPKTWSVYIEKAATTGGDFNAYFNPIQVDAVGKETINALRVTIRNKSFDDVAAEYQKVMERKDSGLTMEVTTVAGTTANRYTGIIPNTELSGIIVIFKIRDKTVIMQTDSMLFQAEFDKLLETITYNA